MKRLIRKTAYLEQPDPIGEFVYFQDDLNYKDMDMNKASLPSYRDGALLVDTKNHKVYWGSNGETHADLVNKYFNIDQYDDDSYKDLDKYVAYGMLLNNFLNAKSVILYGDVPGAAETILADTPDVVIYVSKLDEDGQEGLLRIAKK